MDAHVESLLPTGSRGTATWRTRATVGLFRLTEKPVPWAYEVWDHIATSVDGFIAREDGDLDWLHAAASGDEHYGYKAFMDTVDAIVMGRHTYQKVRGFDKWPYDKPVVVLASSPMEIPPGLRGSVEWLSGLPAEILRGVTRQTPDGLVES